MRPRSYFRRVVGCLPLCGLVWFAELALADPKLKAPFSGSLPPQVARVDRNVNSNSITIGIEFAQPMIPLGGGQDPADAPPIRIEPDLGCEWGWYGQSRLECEYSRETPPPPATRYVAYVSEGLYTRNGEPLPPFRFGFETERPKVESVFIDDWLSPVLPAIRVRTNLPVSAASLAAHLYLAGSQGRVDDFEVRVPDGMEPAESATEWIAIPEVPLVAAAVYRIALDAGLAISEGELRGRKQKNVAWFKTWGAFRFVGAVCDGLHTARDEPLELNTLRPEQVIDSGGCDPRRPVPLVFSAPLADDSLEFLFAETVLEQTAIELNQATSNFALAPVLAHGIPAGRSYELELSGHLRDRFGRPLSGARRMRFAMEEFPPSARPARSTAVIAQGTSVDFVLHALNAERYFLGVRTESASGGKHARGWRNIDVPRRNEPYAVPLGIEVLLGGESGRVFGWAGLRERDTMRMAGRDDLASRAGFPPEGHGLEAEGLTFEAIVTPFNLVVANTHGRTVWVTDIGTGAPVPNARVTLYSAAGQSDASGRVHRCRSIDLTADDAGVARFPPFEADWTGGCNRTFVRAEQDGRLAILPLEGQFSSDSSDYENHDWELYEGGLIVWGVTDKALYRPGETVRYKLYVRQRKDNGLDVPAERAGYTLVQEDYPAWLVFEDPAVELTEFGTHAGSLRLPDNVRDGNYRISLQRTHERVNGGVDFLVATFQPQPYSVAAGSKDELALAGTTAGVTAAAEYTAGGPYSGAVAQILAVITPEEFGVPREPLWEFDFVGERAPPWPEEPLRRTTGDLRFDADGKLTASAELPATGIDYGRLSLSVAARHDNGAWVYSSEVSLPYAKRPYFVGIRHPVWEAGAASSVEVAAVSALGELKAGLRIELELRGFMPGVPAMTTQTPGNGDEYELIQTCEFVSSENIDSCAFAALNAGKYRLTARLFESDRLIHETVHTVIVYVPTSDPDGEPTFLTLDSSLSTERVAYAVGEQAAFTLKNPFGPAQALVLVRRNRVLDHWTQRLERPVETLRLALEDRHSPGVTVQVVIVPAELDHWMAENAKVDVPTWFADLHVDIEVAPSAPPLAMRIDSHRPAFEPGDEVELALAASEPGEFEFAVTVVDEALLRLIEAEQDYFDPDRRQFLRLVDRWQLPESWILSRALLAAPPPLPAVDRIRHILMHGSVPSMQDQGLITVTGSRIAIYDLSELPEPSIFPADEQADSGSAGAFAALTAGLRLRSRFAENAHWEPAVLSDAAGRATVRFELPDDLTRWRAVAIATAKDGRMAMGSIDLPVTLPIEVRAELPAQLVRGDHFSARANATNRGSEPREVTLTLAAEGTRMALPGQPVLSRTYRAEPFRPGSIALPLTAQRQGRIDVVAIARAMATGDALVASVPVRDSIERRTLPLVGTITNGRTAVPIASPADAATDTAELEIGLSASIIGDLTEAFGYMRDFPHACWEQNLSRAVAAANFERLARFVGPEVRYPADFVDSLLRTAGQFEARSGGMTFFQAEDQYVSDYLTTYTAQAFNWLDELGYAVPEYLHGSLRNYVRRRLDEDLSQRVKKTDDRWWPLSADERAAMLAGLAGGGSITPALVGSLLEDRDELSVFGKSELIIALEGEPRFEVLRRDLVDELRSRTKESTTKVEIIEGHRDDPTLLSSGQKSHCAMILALGRRQEAVIDTGWFAKLVRTSQQIGTRAGFGDTHATAICLQALAEYHERHETSPPAAEASAWLNRNRVGGVTLSQDEKRPAALRTTLDLNRPRHSLELDTNTNQPVFYGMRLSYDVDLAVRPAQNAGFTISRSYDVYRDDEWRYMDAATPARIGDWVRVRLRIANPVVRHYVAVSDPVPGGLRPTDPVLSTVAPAGLLETATGSPYFYERQLKPDMSRFYADFLPPGIHEVVYFAQATTEGKFLALPARAEDMYAEDIHGTSDPLTLRISAQVQQTTE